MDNMYEGFSFIICLTIVTLTLIATCRPHTAGLYQCCDQHQSDNRETNDQTKPFISDYHVFCLSK